MGVTVPEKVQPGKASPAPCPVKGQRQVRDAGRPVLHSLPVKQPLESQTLGEFLDLFVATFQL